MEAQNINATCSSSPSNSPPGRATLALDDDYSHARTVSMRSAPTQAMHVGPGIGRNLTEEELEMFSDQQLGQLYQLKQEAERATPSKAALHLRQEEETVSKQGKETSLEKTALKQNEEKQGTGGQDSLKRGTEGQSFKEGRESGGASAQTNAWKHEDSELPIT